MKLSTGAIGLPEAGAAKVQCFLSDLSKNIFDPHSPSLNLKQLLENKIVLTLPARSTPSAFAWDCGALLRRGFNSFLGPSRSPLCSPTLKFTGIQQIGCPREGQRLWHIVKQTYSVCCPPKIGQKLLEWKLISRFSIKSEIVFWLDSIKALIFPPLPPPQSPN